MYLGQGYVHKSAGTRVARRGRQILWRGITGSCEPLDKDAGS